MEAVVAGLDWESELAKETEDLKTMSLVAAMRNYDGPACRDITKRAEGGHRTLVSSSSVPIQISDSTHHGLKVLVTNGKVLESE